VPQCPDGSCCDYSGAESFGGHLRSIIIVLLRIGPSMSAVHPHPRLALPLAALIFFGASESSAQSLRAPWTAPSQGPPAGSSASSTGAASAPSDAPPPPPTPYSPSASSPQAAPWGPPSQGRPTLAAARTEARGAVEFTSDDSAVDVYLVIGTREVTQVLPMYATTPSTFGALGGPFGGAILGPPGFGPVAPVSSSIDPMMNTDLVPIRTTVERRRFLCRTPCTATLPLGTQSVHFRTAGAALGTDTVDVTAQGARYRVRTASAGLYALGQAGLWVGVGVAITGATLLVQGQLACPRGGCSIAPGVITTIVGVAAIGASIPLIVFNGRRSDRLSGRTVVIGPASVTAHF